MKKILLFTTSVLLSFVFMRPPSIMAEPFRQDLRELRSDRRDIRQDQKDVKQDLKNKGIGIHIAAGDLTAINGTTLTVSKDGKTYSVNTDSKTQFRRHFWGKSSLSEFSVGDKVNVIGRFTDDAKTTIQAVLVRDISIQKRNGVFFGAVATISGNTIVLNSKHRGVQTVTVSSSTKFVNRKGEAISLSDIKAGDQIRVKGVWDKTANTITEVLTVKDFSLPAK